MSVFFMATTDEATMELGSSPGLPRTMMRSPACRSARCNGAASFKSLEPGGTRISLASAEMTTFISAPASVVKVRALPEIVLMVPRAGGDLGAGAAGAPCPAQTEKGEPPSRQKPSTTPHKRQLFGRTLLTTTVPIELSSSSPTVTGARSEIAGTLPSYPGARLINLDAPKGRMRYIHSTQHLQERLWCTRSGAAGVLREWHGRIGRN